MKIREKPDWEMRTGTRRSLWSRHLRDNPTLIRARLFPTSGRKDCPLDPLVPNSIPNRVEIYGFLGLLNN